MAYTYYRSITIDHTQCGSSNSSNFPLLVAGTYTYLKTVANGGHVQNSNGYDIAFFSDSALTTALNFERVSWNASTGACEFWVKVPTLSSSNDTVIYTAYGDAGIGTDQQSATSTWDSDFVGVYHMGDGTTFSADDSTSNGNDGTPTDVSASTGAFGGAGSFNGSSSAVVTTTTNFNAGQGPATVEMWVNVTGLGSYTNGTSVFHYGSTSYQAGFGVQAAYSFNEWRVQGAVILNHTATFTDWHHVVVTMGPSRKYSFYLDGVCLDNDVDNNPWGDTWGLNLSNGFNIGGVPSVPSYAQCLIEDCRVSKIQRGADYITATYNNQSSPSAFYSIGSEVGGTTTTTQTLTGNSRITVNTIKTLTANSRITATTTQSISSNARLTATTSQTLSGNATITAASSGFSKYRSITIDHTKVPNTDQTNFPVLISLSDATFKTVANGGHVEDSNGYDIAFYSDSGLTTGLSWEIESYDGSTGTFFAWVKIPSLSHTIDTVIYCAYGDSSISTFQSTASDVWDSNYKAVFHCSEDPGGSAPQLLDSTTSANHLTIETGNPSWGTGSSTVTRVTGKIGKATSFNQPDQYAGLAARSSSNSGMGTGDTTIEGWVNVHNFMSTDGGSGAIGLKPNPSYPYHYNFINIRDDSKIDFYLGPDYNPAYAAGPTSSLSTSIWYHVVGVHDGSTAYLYVNGSLVDSTVVGSGTTDDKISLGFLDRSADATVDEVRYSSIARSADWIATSYNNQSDPSTFYTVGSENTSGSTTTTQTLDGNARITATSTRTLTGSSRVQISGISQTISGNGRIQNADVVQNLSGNSRITATTQQAISGNAKITATTTKSLSGNSRIQTADVVQDLSGNSRIQVTTSQAIDGNATITVTGSATQTITGNASIQNTTTRTLSGNGRIQTAGNQQTLSGNARITVTTSQAIDGNASIITTGTTVQTLIGSASIRNTTTEILQGNSRIQQGASQTISGNSRIEQVVTQSINGNAKITATTSRTLQGNAKITAATSKTIQGNSRVQVPGVSQSLNGNAAIQSTTARSITGNSRIVIPGQGEQTLEGNARIQVRRSETLTGGAYIFVPAISRGVRVPFSNRTVHVEFSNRTVRVPLSNRTLQP